MWCDTDSSVNSEERDFTEVEANFEELILALVSVDPTIFAQYPFNKFVKLY